MTKIHVDKKNVDELADSLDRIFKDIYNELTNDRKFKTDFSAANLIELDKIKLNRNIATITQVLKEIKSLKEFKS